MTPSPEDVANRAERYFADGHNCAMAVLRAVAESLDLACPACIPAVALGLGGGVGHTGRICGAATGAVMALGLAVNRFVDGSLVDKKDETVTLTAGLVNRFVEAFGSAECAALLGFSWSEPDALERFQREGKRERTCTPAVRWAAAEAYRIAIGLR
jgi:C_GCAxxG_C_C family probable redox protein